MSREFHLVVLNHGIATSHWLSQMGLGLDCPIYDHEKDKLISHYFFSCPRI
jgi:hypothetical protein